MDVKNFRSVVIKNGCILGHLTGKMLASGNMPTAFFDLKEQPLNPGINFNLQTVDASRFKAVSGWGDVTHIYEAQADTNSFDKTGCSIHAFNTKTIPPKSKYVSAPFSYTRQLS